MDENGYFRPKSIIGKTAHFSVLHFRKIRPKQLKSQRFPRLETFNFWGFHNVKWVIFLFVSAFFVCYQAPKQNQEVSQKSHQKIQFEQKNELTSWSLPLFLYWPALLAIFKILFFFGNLRNTPTKPNLLRIAAANIFQVKAVLKSDKKFKKVPKIAFSWLKKVFLVTLFVPRGRSVIGRPKQPKFVMSFVIFWLIFLIPNINI